LSRTEVPTLDEGLGDNQQSPTVAGVIQFDRLLCDYLLFRVILQLFFHVQHTATDLPTYLELLSPWLPTIPLLQALGLPWFLWFLDYCVFRTCTVSTL
jgi:hypothetical protein